MNISNVFPSKYLKAADIGDHKPVLTIDRVELETLGQGKDADTCPIIYFVGKEKGLVCNKTNANTLTSFFGEETDDWHGKRVKLMTAPVNYAGKLTMALRFSPEPVPQVDTKGAKVQETEDIPF